MIFVFSLELYFRGANPISCVLQTINHDCIRTMVEKKRNSVQKFYSAFSIESYCQFIFAKRADVKNYHGQPKGT